jgi:hypothetical protein
MGKLINLGEVRRESSVFQMNDGVRPLTAQVSDFLKTYGLFSIDEALIVRAIVRGRGSLDELAVYYLNQILERRLGEGFFIEGNLKTILKKFKGIHFFENEGNGPLRWAVESINSQKYDDFEDVYKILQRGNLPSGGLMNFFDKNKNMNFVLDPQQESFKKGNIVIGRCWNCYRGEEFFCCVDEKKQSQVFVVDRGQGFEKALTEAQKKFFEKKLSQ